MRSSGHNNVDSRGYLLAISRASAESIPDIITISLHSVQRHRVGWFGMQRSHRAIVASVSWPCRHLILATNSAHRRRATRQTFGSGPHTLSANLSTNFSRKIPTSLRPLRNIWKARPAKLAIVTNRPLLERAAITCSESLFPTIPSKNYARPQQMTR